MNQSSPVLHSFANSCSMILMMLFCLVPLLIPLSGCSRPALDKSLLTGEPCSAPCWHNLVPGESTEDDVRRELGNSPWVKPGTVSSGGTEYAGVPGLAFAWKDRGRKERLKLVWNRIRLRDGKVSLVEINLDYDLTLGEVVSRYGPPEGVYARLVGGKEVITYEVILDYPARGLEFSSYSFPDNLDDIRVRTGVGIVTEDLKVTAVYYYAPTSLESALRDVFLYPPERVEAMLGDEQAWPGFGEEVAFAYFPRR